MNKRKKIWIITIMILTAVFAAVVGFGIWLQNAQFGFDREVGDREMELRQQVVHTAQAWLASEEGSDAHKEILAIYNTHEQLAQGMRYRKTTVGALLLEVLLRFNAI